MIIPSLGRDLEPSELRRLVADYAQRPELWRHLIHHDPEARTYEQIERDEHVGVWLLCWMKDHDTGFHDHDLSSGGIAWISAAVRSLPGTTAGAASPITPARRATTRLSSSRSIAPS